MKKISKYTKIFISNILFTIAILFGFGILTILVCLTLYGCESKIDIPSITTTQIIPHRIDTVFIINNTNDTICINKSICRYDTIVKYYQDSISYKKYIELEKEVHNNNTNRIGTEININRKYHKLEYQQMLWSYEILGLKNYFFKTQCQQNQLYNEWIYPLQLQNKQLLDSLIYLSE
jgi:hypothetical protein